MRRLILILVGILCVPAVATAHVSVRPRESKVGATERYTMRVPTEGKVSTTSVELEVPEGVTISEVFAPTGGKYEVKKEGERIVWKAHQRYADGTSSDWVGPAGDRRPAPFTKLLPAAP